MRNRGAKTAGFTLVEMMAAIGILVFGLTSLVGLLSVGVSARSTAELRDRAVRAADQVFLDLAEEVVVTLPDEVGSDPAAAGSIEYDPVAGYPRLKAVVTMKRDPAHPRLVLASVRISWKEEGISVGETFSRIMSRAAPFPARVGRMRNQK